MDKQQKLDFGIEIVSAMKASAYDVSIEDGRIMALEETEVDRMEGITPEYLENSSQEDKDMFIRMAKSEKERLHKQAMFVAEIALSFLKRNQDQSCPPHLDKKPLTPEEAYSQREVKCFECGDLIDPKWIKDDTTIITCEKCVRKFLKKSI